MARVDWRTKFGFDWAFVTFSFCVAAGFVTYGALRAFHGPEMTPLPHSTELLLVVFGWGLVFRTLYYTTLDEVKKA